MTEISKYLSIAANEEHLGSYYKIAKHLGVSPSYIYQVRDKGGLSDSQCIEIAGVINEDPMKLIAARNIDLAKDETTKSFWERIASGIVWSVAPMLKEPRTAAKDLYYRK